MAQPVVNHGGRIFLNEMHEPPTPGAYELFGVVRPSLRSSAAKDDDRSDTATRVPTHNW
jgi:hypothetical protein